MHLFPKKGVSSLLSVGLTPEPGTGQDGVELRLLPYILSALGPAATNSLQRGRVRLAFGLVSHDS